MHIIHIHSLNDNSLNSCCVAHVRVSWEGADTPSD